MAEKHEGCVSAAAGPIRPAMNAQDEPATGSSPEKEGIVKARVGEAAPDFEATAFVDGGFQNVKLSDYRGKWVALCFYPGDFTFV